MSDYNVFSLFYDAFTDDVNYPERAKYILSLFEKFDRRPSLMLDLACGTGNFSVEFANEGIEVIGVDISEDMLGVAQEKNAELEKPVMYICQPAEELELFGTVDGAVCMLDSLNHITDYDGFKRAIARTALFLEEGRLFIFDLNTPYQHREILKDAGFKIKKDKVHCVWSNYYSPENNTVKICLDFTVKKSLFSREYYSEEFYERTFSDEEINEALTEAGLVTVAVYGENSFEAPKENSQRNIYITRRI